LANIKQTSTTTSGAVNDAVNDVLLALTNSSMNNTSVLLGGISQLLDVTLYDIVGSLANIKQTIKTTSGAINDVLLAVEKNTSVLLGTAS
jgi:hypothetical protein